MTTGEARISGIPSEVDMRKFGNSDRCFQTGASEVVRRFKFRTSTYRRGVAKKSVIIESEEVYFPSCPALVTFLRNHLRL